MRMKEATRIQSGKEASVEATDSGHHRWTGSDYALAAALARLLVAPAPFFWVPPVWIFMLMRPLCEAPRHRSAKAVDAG